MSVIETNTMKDIDELSLCLTNNLKFGEHKYKKRYKKKCKELRKEKLKNKYYSNIIY